jgi:hypothetical protein
MPTNACARAAAATWLPYRMSDQFSMALRSRAGLKYCGVTPHAQAGRFLLGTNRSSGHLAHLLRHFGPAL